MSNTNRVLRFVWLAAVALALFAPVSAQAIMAPVAKESHAGLKEIGRGRLTFLGFGIYKTSLWSNTGKYAGLRAGQTLALSLWYERKFTRSELIAITVREWQRLGLASAEQQTRWTRELERHWLDVRPGDNMTIVMTPEGETHFYRQDRSLGTVQDPQFGPALLAIWLDPRTAVADLRQQMLGDRGA
jgi:Chalcone isomerase-like